MKRIWSPWRMAYVTAEKAEGCVFCDKIQEDDDIENLILLRGERCFVMMNRYPYNNGHLMVVPHLHVDSPTKLDADTMFEMMSLVNICLSVLTDAMHPDGYNVGMNLGASGGAGIADHLHMHVVPRWTGDTNFMPVLGDTRVIVQALCDCYDQLRPRFDCCELGPQPAPTHTVPGETPEQPL